MSIRPQNANLLGSWVLGSFLNTDGVDSCFSALKYVQGIYLVTNFRSFVITTIAINLSYLSSHRRGIGIIQYWASLEVVFPVCQLLTSTPGCNIRFLILLNILMFFPVSAAESSLFCSVFEDF